MAQRVCTPLGVFLHHQVALVLQELRCILVGLLPSCEACSHQRRGCVHGHALLLELLPSCASLMDVVPKVFSCGSQCCSWTERNRPSASSLVREVSSTGSLPSTHWYGVKP